MTTNRSKWHSEPQTGKRWTGKIIDWHFVCTGQLWSVRSCQTLFEIQRLKLICNPNLPNPLIGVVSIPANQKSGWHSAWLYQPVLKMSSKISSEKGLATLVPPAWRGFAGEDRKMSHPYWTLQEAPRGHRRWLEGGGLLVHVVQAAFTSPDSKLPNSEQQVVSHPLGFYCFPFSVRSAAQANRDAVRTAGREEPDRMWSSYVLPGRKHHWTQWDLLWVSKHDKYKYYTERLL